MVKSEKIFSPQNYVMSIVNECYFFHTEDDITQIDKILDKYGYDNLWDFPLSEIDEIVSNDIDVVLVQCVENGQLVLRWFEVPEDWVEPEN